MSRVSLPRRGYTVERQTFAVMGVDCQNLVAQTGPAGLDREVLVVGAHYDSFANCPAANDNGSGVAALLELARCLAGRPLERTVRFVAFANEEPPFFWTDDMGSLRYARACEERATGLWA
jgi:Zn-dependent M28 family amino/carboxypeptidase